MAGAFFVGSKSPHMYLVNVPHPQQVPTPGMCVDFCRIWTRSIIWRVVE